MTAIDASSTHDGSVLTLEWAEAARVHERWLRTVITARLGETQAIDEVMQEVHLAAVRQRTPLSEVREVGAWLYRLALRQTLLYRRRRGREARLVDRYAASLEPGGNGHESPDPLLWLLADERSRLVREALAQLPRRDAEVLLLKYTENWSYRDLARHLGLSEGAVESRLHRAKQRLRALLADPRRDD
jgi:RNA polymerase sigma-70 factor (ECF subfamily)